jgi:hypothetical protein
VAAVSESSPVSGAVGRRRPPLGTAFWVIPAGGFVALRIAVGYVALMLLPRVVFDPSTNGGSGSVDYLIIALMIGAAIGSTIGALAGLVLAAVTMAGWLCRLPEGAIATCGSIVVVVIGFWASTAWLPRELWDLSVVTLALYGCVHGIGGAILLAWAGEVRSGRRAWYK